VRAPVCHARVLRAVAHTLRVLVRRQVCVRGQLHVLGLPRPGPQYVVACRPNCPVAPLTGALLPFFLVARGGGGAVCAWCRLQLRRQLRVWRDVQLCGQDDGDVGGRGVCQPGLCRLCVRRQLHVRHRLPLLGDEGGRGARALCRWEALLLFRARSLYKQGRTNARLRARTFPAASAVHAPPPASRRRRPPPAFRAPASYEALPGFASAPAPHAPHVRVVHAPIVECQHHGVALGVLQQPQQPRPLLRPNGELAP
jgi:hypothetical protein